MKARPTDLAQYELLHGQTEYAYDFPAAPSCELLIDIFADRPVSIFLHVCKEGVDKWVPVVSGERRVDFRGRFANCVGARIHCAKECTLNCLVVGHPVGVDPIDYTPVVVHSELASMSMEERLRREFAAMLDARLPQRSTRKEIEIDPDLMGDEIPERAGSGFEIDDDDPLDPIDGLLVEDVPPRDPVPDDNRTGEDPDRGPARARARQRGDESTASDQRPAGPDGQEDDPELPTAPAGRPGPVPAS